MRRKPVNRIVRAVCNALRQRDRREMEAASALLSLLEPPLRGRRRPAGARRRLRG
jgi:hypothetical protein